ncbi:MULTISPECIES: SHOCT domain-containing protein [unclassified Cryobacterium]|uniref:SHOCT domain-containing protein n=2 Tax=Cryobacterium TaxID=69578 RepID=UPI002AB3FF25|nr:MULTISPECIES: SHOCT domain-containing protein [unclassified Cryobacterium]MDY7555341.1 SHOCT domain-containing protein [Cryobacterium sp. 10C3]MEB0292535.1 SHOCT domain-containing protein [Cryobacterium sp. 10C2]
MNKEEEMMWGNGYNMGAAGWVWPIGLLLLVGIVLLVIWAVRASAGGANRGRRDDSSADSRPRGPSAARQVLDERFAKGELNAEEYRERLKVLGEKAK